MNRTDRLYALVEELRASAPRARSAQRLAERFEVAVRTIQRDILALQEAVALAMARSGPMPFDGAARTALHKVLAAMSATGRRGADDLLARIHLLHAKRELAAGPVARAVEQAVVERRVLCLDYRDKHGQPTRARRVEPLGFVGAERDWYLVGWCRLRDAVRVFRLDRISMIEVTAERSPERPPVALDDGCPAQRSWHPAIVA